MDGLYLDKYQFSFYSLELLGEIIELSFLTFPFPTAFLLLVLPDSMHSSKTIFLDEWLHRA